MNLEASGALIPSDKDSAVVDIDGKATFTFGPTNLCGSITVVFSAAGLEEARLIVKFVK